MIRMVCIAKLDWASKGFFFPLNGSVSGKILNLLFFLTLNIKFSVNLNNFPYLMAFTLILFAFWYLLFLQRAHFFILRNCSRSATNGSALELKVSNLVNTESCTVPKNVVKNVILKCPAIIAVSVKSCTTANCQETLLLVAFNQPGWT